MRYAVGGVGRGRERERRLICSSVSSISSRELKRHAGMCGTGVRPRPRSRPTACATSSKCPNDGSIMLTNASAPGSIRGCEEHVSEESRNVGLKRLSCRVSKCPLKHSERERLARTESEKHKIG